MKILVISGKAGSGKTFLAEKIKNCYEKQYGWRVAHLAFADPLKMVLSNIYGWDGHKGENGRELLQKVGTDIVHENNKMCWTNITVEIIKGLQSEFDLFIVSDARFVHEIEGLMWALPKAEVITIRINGKSSLSGDSATHPSETSLDGYDFDFIFNNHSYDVDSFYFNLHKLIFKLQGST